MRFVGMGPGDSRPNSGMFTRSWTEFDVSIPGGIETALAGGSPPKIVKMLETSYAGETYLRVY